MITKNSDEIRELRDHLLGNDHCLYAICAKIYTR